MNAESRPKVQSASTLAGYRVRNEQNDDLGTIEELMIDSSSGRVAYAVLSLGGFLGSDDKLLAVPWSLLSLHDGEAAFVLNADLRTLENAPALDSEQWPDFADERWGTELHAHYGRQPYWVFSN
ncbi:MAG: PRC-barrel domain-containing protein [Bryobacteraceae bacterium]